MALKTCSIDDSRSDFIWSKLYSDDYLIREECAAEETLNRHHLRFLFTDQRFGCTLVLRNLVLRHDLPLNTNQLDVLFHYFPLETMRHPLFEPTPEQIEFGLQHSPECRFATLCKQQT